MFEEKSWPGTLGWLIKTLSEEPLNIIVPIGFHNPHSYRGYYEQLAFEPLRNITISEMLKAAQSALGQTFSGWKGGNYKMSEFTEVWLAYEGEGGGETLGPTLLSYMLGKPTLPEPER